ncbi:hypothetical protein PVAP13_9NG325846 [Panicum virgatum]|uniref:Uncharacterized protein n=1 Tax=Panicum virgatum TaxID=38727 RepID=A0A8T0MM90_PANVG|nr:hypothetical protein PVAP13_9NG325846 [Panicum virgatum]
MLPAPPTAPSPPSPSPPPCCRPCALPALDSTAAATNRSHHASQRAALSFHSSPPQIAPAPMPRDGLSPKTAPVCLLLLHPYRVKPLAPVCAGLPRIQQHVSHIGAPAVQRSVRNDWGPNISGAAPRTAGGGGRVRCPKERRRRMPRRHQGPRQWCGEGRFHEEQMWRMHSTGSGRSGVH